MNTSFTASTRRSFLQSTVAGLGGLAGYEHLMAADADVNTPRDWSLRYDGEIEPIVRLMEQKPLDEGVEELIVRLKRGMSYRQFVAALFLAGLRNGHDTSYYHCIFMIHSAHYMSLHAPLDERIMGMFGGLGAFKNWQGRYRDGGGHFGWRQRPEKLPPADQALVQYREATTHNDPDGAEAAMIVLAQTYSPQQLQDFIVPYVLADGVHGFICTSNCFRIFPVIGWHRAEPALRMMARLYAGQGHWSQRWLKPRVETARKKFGSLPAGWTHAQGDKAATLEVMASLRERKHEKAFEFVYQQLAFGRMRSGSIWDAIHLISGEQYMATRGGGDHLHQNTGMNALHYLFRTCIDPEVRLMTMMKAVFWTAKWGARRIRGSKTMLDLEPAEIPALPQVAAEEIFHSSIDNDVVGKVFAFAQQHPHSQAAWDIQRRVTFGMPTDGHSYKYLAAVWEDTYQVSEHWRPHKFASVFGGQTGAFPGVTSTINMRVREALRGA